jgi:hypothetical protein
VIHSWIRWEQEGLGLTKQRNKKEIRHSALPSPKCGSVDTLIKEQQPGGSISFENFEKVGKPDVPLTK